MDSIIIVFICRQFIDFYLILLYFKVSSFSSIRGRSLNTFRWWQERKTTCPLPLAFKVSKYRSFLSWKVDEVTTTEFSDFFHAKFPVLDAVLTVIYINPGYTTIASALQPVIKPVSSASVHISPNPATPAGSSLCHRHR